MSDYYGNRDRDEGGFLPSEVQESLKNLERSLRRMDIELLARFYEEESPALTAKYYKASAWPTPEAVEKKITSDKMFNAFYQEIYYRHIYAKLEPTIHDRFHSFQNYINLFNIFLQLDADEPQVDLPEQWLWDILDEFIHQFQSFHMYRTDMGASANSKDQQHIEECKMLKDHVHVWSAQTIIRYLSALIEKANNAIKRPSRSKHNKNFWRALYEFSVVCQCQVMCLISDYTSSLEILAKIDFNNKNSIVFEIEGSRAALYYHMGFGYLMLRRYRDAIDVFSIFLREAAQLTFGGETFQKVEPTKDLLAIAIALFPHGVDDSVLQSIQEKLPNFFPRLMEGDWTAFEEVFCRACPPFISPFVPSFTEPKNETIMVQVQMLREEVKQREKFSDTYNVLKMCTSMAIDTLSDATSRSTEDLTTQLLNVKHKTRAKRHQNLSSQTRGKKKYKPPIEGDWIGEPELSFYISKDMVFVGEKNTEKSCGDYFIEQTLNLDKLMRYIDNSIKFREQ